MLGWIFPFLQQCCVCLDRLGLVFDGIEPSLRFAAVCDLGHLYFSPLVPLAGFLFSPVDTSSWFRDPTLCRSVSRSQPISCLARTTCTRPGPRAPDRFAFVAILAHFWWSCGRARCFVVSVSHRPRCVDESSLVLVRPPRNRGNRTPPLRHTLAVGSIAGRSFRPGEGEGEVVRGRGAVLTPRETWTGYIPFTTDAGGRATVVPDGFGGGSPSDGPRKTRGRNERKRERRIGILPRNGRGGHVARIWTGEDLDRRHRRTRRKERSEHVDDGVQVDPACSSAGVEAAGWKKTRTIVPTFGRAKEPGRMQAWMSGGRVVSAWRRWQDVSPVQDARNGSCAGCGHPYPQTEDAVRAFVQATAKTAVHPEGTPMGCTEHVIPPGTSTSSCILPAFRSPPMSRMPPWPGRRFTSALVFLDRRLGRAEPGPGGTSTKRTPRRCCEAADLAMRKSELRRNRGPSALLREEQKTRGCRGNGVVRRRNLPNIHETRTRGPTVLSEAQTRQHPCIDDESIQRGHATGDGGSWKRSGSNGCRFCERSTPKGIAFQWSPKLDKCCADLSC